MDIAFSCPHCKQHIAAPPEMGGTAVNCPTCKGAILVPRIGRISCVFRRVRDTVRADSGGHVKFRGGIKQGKRI